MLDLADACPGQMLDRLHLRLIGGQPQRAIELGHLPQGECGCRCRRQLEAQLFCPQVCTLRLQCLQPVVSFLGRPGRAVDCQGLRLIEQRQEIVRGIVDNGRFDLLAQFKHGLVIEARAL
ncbi:hypothetical protein D3C84_971490 [compost metagenome]